MLISGSDFFFFFTIIVCKIMLVMPHLPLWLTFLNIFSRAYLKIRSCSFCFMVVAPFPLLYAKMVAKAAQISEDVTDWREQVFWSHNLPAQHLSSARCCHLLANYIVHISVALQKLSLKECDGEHSTIQWCVNLLCKHYFSKHVLQREKKKFLSVKPSS